jgi:hypothetical protein
VATRADKYRGKAARRERQAQRLVNVVVANDYLQEIFLSCFK